MWHSATFLYTFTAIDNKIVCTYFFNCCHHHWRIFYLIHLFIVLYVLYSWYDPHKMVFNVNYTMQEYRPPDATQICLRIFNFFLLWWSSWCLGGGVGVGGIVGCGWWFRVWRWRRDGSIKYSQ